MIDVFDLPKFIDECKSTRRPEDVVGLHIARQLAETPRMDKVFSILLRVVFFAEGEKWWLHYTPFLTGSEQDVLFGTPPATRLAMTVVREHGQTEDGHVLSTRPDSIDEVLERAESIRTRDLEQGVQPNAIFSRIEESVASMKDGGSIGGSGTRIRN